MSPERLYTRVEAAYRCAVCAQDFDSYHALARHQFNPVDPCVTALSDQPPILPHDAPAFDGELLPVPQGPTDPDSLAEHRDEFGILRVSGMVTGYRRWNVGRVDGVFRLFPMLHGGSRPYPRGVLRQRWINPMSPAGRTYPSPKSPRHVTYRDTADFRGVSALLPYVGWFCDEHGPKELTEVSWEGRCNFPTGRVERCKQWAQVALKSMRFSWCLEHAPMIVETETVMANLRDYYDVDAVRRFAGERRPATPETVG